MRPDFITDEDIARWDISIDNDTELTDVVGADFAKNPVTREVLYTSLWMTEILNKMNLTPAIIAASQNVLGQQSFGADPWQVADVIINCFTKKDEADVIKAD